MENSEFTSPYTPNTDADRRKMLSAVGVSSADELFQDIPSRYRNPTLDLPPPLSEYELRRDIESMAGENTVPGDYACFLGAGSYRHYVPAVVRQLAGRSEYMTCYTPYQPEVSQGTLQAHYEFQSLVCQLTGMDVAIASVYDGASACAEAVLMAGRLNRGRRRVVIPRSLHPFYKKVLQTYTENMDINLDVVPLEETSGRIDLAALERMLDEEVSCLVVAQPNFFGVIEELEEVARCAKGVGALLVTVVSEALSLALLKPPGECGVDIVVGEAQSFGVPVYFGGPYLGFMAARGELTRQLPGRIAGQTVDLDGRRGFVLTLATREQHIRRENATSNICTNQNLVMMAALIYLTLMGGDGLREVAGQNVSLLAYFLAQLESLPGYRLRFNGPRFNEVTLA